jgi:hypothetical protein
MAYFVVQNYAPLNSLTSVIYYRQKRPLSIHIAITSIQFTSLHNIEGTIQYIPKMTIMKFLVPLLVVGALLVNPSQAVEEVRIVT